MVEEDRMLTIEQVAERLAMKPSTLRTWLKSGYLSGFKIGREWRVSERELAEFIESHRVTGGEEG